MPDDNDKSGTSSPINTAGRDIVLMADGSVRDADLRPPPESAHFRWHWIYVPCSGPEPWRWDPVTSMWLPSRETVWHTPSLFPASRYVGPCDPAALTINPEDAGQRERVARAICASYGDVFDEQPVDLSTLREQRWKESRREVHPHDPGLPTQSDWMDAARDALKALSDA